jgi:pimeloyl-ACP methyl ester carboxylesterase
MASTRITTIGRDGMTFDVSDSGPVDGRPLILLHGFPTDRTSWHRIEPLLHRAGLRTFAPDQRGYCPGASPGGRAAYRLEELTSDVLTLADATGNDKVHLVGHDWGGIVAWLVAGNWPDRVASLTVLSTPHPAALRRALRTPDQLRRSWYMAGFQLPLLPEFGLAKRFRSVIGRSGLPADDLERYAARFDSPQALTGPLGWYRAMPISRVHAHRVRVPTTYVWGSRDFALGRRAAELTTEHVVGPYEFIELNAGHWLPETRADECAAAIIARVASA